MRNHILTTAFLLTISLTMSCSRSMEIPTIVVNQPNKANKKPITTPINTNQNLETSPLDLSKVPTVTYCELTRNAADHDRKIVRVRGIYFNGFERMLFYDEHCVNGEPPTAPKDIPAETWIQWDDDYRLQDVSEQAKQYRAIKSGERKDVTVVGKFYGTRDINNTGSGKYQLRIMSVEILSIPGE